MKRMLRLATLVALPLMWASSVEAKITETPAANFGLAEEMSFEVEDTAWPWNCRGWWATSGKEGENFYGMWARTDAQAADGDYSMKCEIAQTTENTQPGIETPTTGADGTNTVQLETEKTYQLKAKVWIDAERNADLKTLHVYFSGVGETSQWIDVSINTLATVNKGEWVSLTSKTFTADANQVYKMILKANADASVGGDVLFYVDQLELVEITETANTGFGDEDMMDFEIAEGGTAGGADGWWANNKVGNYFNRTEEKAYSGSASLKIEIPQGSTITDANFIQTDDKEDANAARISEVGDYILSRYIWIDPACNDSLTDIYTFLNTGGAWIVASVNITDLAKGEWVNVETPINVAVAGTGKMTLKVNVNAATGSDVKVYIDNFQLLKSTGIESNETAAFAVSADREGIAVRLANIGERVEVYNVAGTLVASQEVISATTHIAVDNGIYIVRVGNKALKVVK